MKARNAPPTEGRNNDATEARNTGSRQANKQEQAQKARRQNNKREQTTQRKTRFPKDFRPSGPFWVFAPVSPELRASSERLLCCCFCGWESLRRHPSESASDLSFPQGCDSQRSPPHSPPALCVAHQGSQALALSLCAKKRRLRSHSRRVSRVCVLIVGCGLKTTHTHASRDGARNHSTPSFCTRSHTRM